MLCLLLTERLLARLDRSGLALEQRRLLVVVGARLLQAVLEALDLAVVGRAALLELGAQREQLGVDGVLLGQLLLPLAPPLVHRLLPLLQLLVLAGELERLALDGARVRLEGLGQLVLVPERVGAQLGGEGRLLVRSLAQLVVHLLVLLLHALHVTLRLHLRRVGRVEQRAHLVAPDDGHVALLRRLVRRELLRLRLLLHRRRVARALDHLPLGAVELLAHLAERL